MYEEIQYLVSFVVYNKHRKVVLCFYFFLFGLDQTALYKISTLCLQTGRLPGDVLHVRWWRLPVVLHRLLRRSRSSALWQRQLLQVRHRQTLAWSISLWCYVHTLTLPDLVPAPARCFCVDCLDILVDPGASNNARYLDPWRCYMCQPLLQYGVLKRRYDWSLKLQEFFANDNGQEFVSLLLFI